VLEARNLSVSWSPRGGHETDRDITGAPEDYLLLTCCQLFIDIQE